MKTEHELRTQAGRAQQKLIADYFGWTPWGFGFPRENSSFLNPRDPKLDKDYEPPRYSEFTLGGQASLALLRFILAEGEQGPVHFYFDVEKDRHVRCSEDSPWAGSIVAGNRIVLQYR